jgi:hypothetical protein
VQTDRQAGRQGLGAAHSESPAEKCAASLGISFQTDRVWLPGIILLLHSGITFRQNPPAALQALGENGFQSFFP